MATIANLVIGVDVKGADAVEAKFGKLGGTVDRLGQRAGKFLAAGLAIGGAAAVKMGQKASDLEETVSKASQIFGSQAVPALQKFAGAAAKNLGQSRQTALDAAATFGVFGKSAGLAGSDLVGFSTEMTKLASDMASFNNTSPEEAIEAIGAGLRGESEPLRRFGVLLDDATLREEALRQGLIKTTKNALTPQQKVLAAQGVIMKQTSDQQGDFARTSDGLANKQRKMTAQFENLQVKLGAKVLPILLKLTDAGLKIIDWVERNQRLVGTLVVVFGSLAAALFAASVAMRAYLVITKAIAIATKAWAAIQAVLNVVLTLNPIGLIILAIVALIVIVVLLVKHWDKVKAATAVAWNFIKKIVGAAVKFLVKLFLNFTPVGLIIKHWATIKKATLAVWNFIKGFIRAQINAVIGFIKLIGRGVAIVRAAFARMRAAAVAKAMALVSFVRSIPRRIRSALGNLGRLLFSAGRNVIQGLINGIRSMLGAVGSAASSIASKIRGFLPFSPAKEGPLSGRGNPERSGATIPAMLAAGMLSGTGTVADAADAMLAAADLGGGAFGVGTPGGVRSARRDPLVVRLVVDGADSDMKRMIRKMVRVDGRGDVQVAFGS